MSVNLKKAQVRKEKRGGEGLESREKWRGRENKARDCEQDAMPSNLLALSSRIKYEESEINFKFIIKSRFYFRILLLNAH